MTLCLKADNLLFAEKMWDLTLLLKSHVLTQTGTASGRAGLLVQLFNTENTVAR